MFGIFARLFVFLLLIMGPLTPAHAAKRVALVIGNSAYTHATPLRNPKNDAEAVTELLTKLDFDVVRGIDLDHQGMRGAIRDFAYKLRGAEVALFFYAGHGLQVKDRNYLAPIDAKLANEIDLEFEALRLEMVLSQMEASATTSLVFLDACRDNPLARNLARTMGTRSANAGRGLARVESGVGTLIAFATQPGNVALDGRDKHSPFTAALAKHIETPGLDVALVMRRVRQEVIDMTGGAQVPWNNSSLTSSFFFKEEATAEPVAQTETPSSDVERDFWRTADQIGTIEAYQAYLAKFPDGDFASLARIRIAKLVAERGKTQTAEVKPLDRAPAASAAAAPALPAKPATPTKAEEASKPVEVAALQESDKTSAATDIVEGETDPRELALALQTELKRVGCDPGALDGNWGRKGRAAITRFNTHAKLSLPGDQPTLQAIDAIKVKKACVCPLPIAKPKPVKKKPARTVKTTAPKKKASPKKKRCRTVEYYSTTWHSFRPRTICD